MEQHAPQPHFMPSPTPLWLAAAAILLFTAGVCAWAFLGLHRSEVPLFLTGVQAQVDRHAATGKELAGVLTLAGSGSNLPLTRRLAEAFKAEQPGNRLLIHESIGSAGGIRAVHDGLIRLGLISRPLNPEEQRLGLVAIPYARVPVVVAANPSVPDAALTSAELLDIYRGIRRRWNDGSPIVVLQREHGDSSHASFNQRMPGFAEANDEAYRQQRWQVLFSDAAMHRTLQETPGAVGLLDLGQVNLLPPALKVLTLDGVAPSPENLTAGAYPYSKDLAFVHAGQLESEAAAFLRFVRSSSGQELIRAAGYLPLGEEKQ